jgi:hypothetical protein
LTEAVPRLEFVAYAMLRDGLQRISRPGLVALLRQARDSMPELLAYSTESDDAFIDRVELRSSLLVRAGDVFEGGVLSPVFEFRHLAFQEYLTARAIATNHFPNAKPGATPVRTLRRFMHVEAWREVIPLAAVLSEAGAPAIVEHLIEGAQLRSKESEPGRVGVRRKVKSTNPFRQLIAQCLADEVRVAPDLARRAMATMIGSAEDAEIAPRVLETIAGGRYGPLLEEVACQLAQEMSAVSPEAGSIIGTVTTWRLGAGVSLPVGRTDTDELQRLLDSDDDDARMSGCLALMNIAFRVASGDISPDNSGREPFPAQFVPAAGAAADLVRDKSVGVAYAASWALAWIGMCDWKCESLDRLLFDSYGIWSDLSRPAEARRQAAWATCTNWRSRHRPFRGEPRPSRDRLLALLDVPREEYWPFATSVAAATLLADVGLVDDRSRQIATVLSGEGYGFLDERWATELLMALGPEGQAAADDLKERTSSSKRLRLNIPRDRSET